MAQDDQFDTKMAAIWRDAIAGVDSSLKVAATDAAKNPSALIDAWISVESNPAFPLRPVRREPASPDEIRAAELKLGSPLPEQLRELYGSTNGLEWVKSTGRPMKFGGHFPEIANLKLAGQLKVPFSSQLQKNWEELEEPAQPKHVELYGPAVMSHIVDTPQHVFTFGELDEFLSLRDSDDARNILIAHRNDLPVSHGVVLEVENLIATRYESLSHWLSANSSLLMPAVRQSRP